MSIERERINFAEINKTVLADYPHYLQMWLPHGKFEGGEYVSKNPRRHDRKSGSFKVNCRTGNWADFATGDAGKTPLSLYAYLSDLSYAQAGFRLAEELRGKSFFVAPSHFQDVQEDKNSKDQKNKEYALKLWNAAFPVKNTVVEKYLASRGIHISIPEDIRLLSGHKHAPSGRIYPVMLSAIRKWPSKEIIAVHRTWILPDGSGKAPVEPAKMMLGGSLGGCVQLAPAASKMVVSEGIETGLSVYQCTGIPVWAGLSTSGITGLVLPDLPLGEEIIIACDNDPAGRKAAIKAAEKLTSEGRNVRLAFPPENSDFNDLLKEYKQ